MLEKERTMADAIRTALREDRVLCGPTITFAIAEEINLLKQEPEWMSGTRNAVTVEKTSNLSIVLTAIKKVATLCGPSSAFSCTPSLVLRAPRSPSRRRLFSAHYQYRRNPRRH
jgi:hypothetical protein